MNIPVTHSKPSSLHTGGVASTRGHLCNQMGLRGHSVGSFFPCIISFIGTPDALRYLVTTPTGTATLNTWEEAAALAGGWKERRSWRDDLPDVVQYAHAYYQSNTDPLTGETDVEAGVSWTQADFVCLYCRDKEGTPIWLCDVKPDLNRIALYNVIHALQGLPL